MNAARYVHAHVFPAAFALLPAAMDCTAARAMLLAIGLQESTFQYRFQQGGPARGFWQFERGGGVTGVLVSASTQPTMERVCSVLQYTPTPLICFNAIPHNDVLAACFARLLLWSDPKPLPVAGESAAAWDLYVRTWRPGKPHRDTWDAYYAEAWRIAQGGGL